MRAGLVALLALTGCTQVVDVDGYTFDVDPCAMRTTTCEPGGGTTLVYVAVRGGTARPDAMGRRDGFDLDGTADRVCGQVDFTAPDGTGGIDNQASLLIETVESTSDIDTWAMTQATFATGGDVILMEIQGYDGPNDDCVQISQRGGRLAVLDPPQDPDADDDGLLDPGLVFDFGPSAFLTTEACTIDGVLHARFDEAIVDVGLGTELTIRRARVRVELDGTASDEPTVAVGGAIPIEELTALLPDAATFLRNAADLGSTTPRARDCSLLSAGLTFEFVPAISRGPL